MASQSSKAFKDISLSFQPHPVTGDIPVLKNEDAVRNLIETSAGERPFKDALGTGVRDALFEFIDFPTASVVAQQIFDVLNGFEGRIDNVIVNVEPRPEDHSFEVQISYDIIGDSFPKQEFEFLLETTR
jgi:hypothetical protein